MFSYRLDLVLLLASIPGHIRKTHGYIRKIHGAIFPHCPNEWMSRVMWVQLLFSHHADRESYPQVIPNQSPHAPL